MDNATVYHFVGIKGSGMSALALMLHQMGHKVQGSDVEKYYFTQRGLEQACIKILPFDEKNLQGDLENGDWNRPVSTLWRLMKPTFTKA